MVQKILIIGLILFSLMLFLTLGSYGLTALGWGFFVILIFLLFGHTFMRVFLKMIENLPKKNRGALITSLVISGLFGGILGVPMMMSFFQLSYLGILAFIVWDVLFSLFFTYIANKYEIIKESNIATFTSFFLINLLLAFIELMYFYYNITQIH